MSEIKEKYSTLGAEKFQLSEKRREASAKQQELIKEIEELTIQINEIFDKMHELEKEFTAEVRLTAEEMNSILIWGHHYKNEFKNEFKNDNLLNKLRLVVFLPPEEV